MPRRTRCRRALPAAWTSATYRLAPPFVTSSASCLSCTSGHSTQRGHHDPNGPVPRGLKGAWPTQPLGLFGASASGTCQQIRGNPAGTSSRGCDLCVAPDKGRRYELWMTTLVDLDTGTGLRVVDPQGCPASRSGSRPDPRPGTTACRSKRSTSVRGPARPSPKRCLDSLQGHWNVLSEA